MIQMEIGSEFDINLNLYQGADKQTRVADYLNFLGNSVFLLSGRTAIELACKDILLSREVRNVYMPAYCCSSMIDPFLKNGITVEFYDVCPEEGRINFKINKNKDIDILYLNNYFGFKSPIEIEWVRRKKEEGTIVMYDKTHSLFLVNDTWLEIADYTLCSLRKWFAIISGAVLSKREGDFSFHSLKECTYTREKLQAQQLKSRYLSGDKYITKEMFYPKFQDFDRKLNSDYVAYKIDDVSCRLLDATDFGMIMRQRKQNASLIYERLQEIKGLNFMFANLDEEVTPLFVPVLMDTPELKTKLKSLLIEQQIYCPSHWPKNNLVTPGMEVNKIFDKEISLVCDQRYTTEELDRMIQTILNILK